VPEIVKQAMTGTAVQQILEHVHANAASGGFDRPDAHLSRTDVALDQRGWTEMSEELRRMLSRLEEIHAASTERLKAANHADEIRGTVVLAMLEVLAPPDAPPAPRRKSNRRVGA
jgi:hypothetical protein